MSEGELEYLVLIMLCELHSHLPHESKPLSMSDLSNEQAIRAKAAVCAVLAKMKEWQHD